MAIYVLTGKLGNGKTLLAVRKIQEALEQGRRVATNLDLRLEKMLSPWAGRPRISDGAAKWYQPLSCVRLPDKPTVQDLESCGLGADELDESRYGLMVLDELGSWLNSREWADKQRQGVIDWLIHSRKKRWDIIFIVQHTSMLDKQVRESLLEYHVSCKRLDKIRIPVLGWLGQLLTFGAWDGRVGKVHLGVVVYAGGASIPQNAVVTDRWLYRGTDLYQAYDTEQQFSSRYDQGVFSYLPPWHVDGRYREQLTWSQAAWRWLLVELGIWSPPRRADPPDRLRPLLRLPPELRWRAARHLVQRGLL